MTFEEAIPIILEFEGGYTWHEADPGGETKYGIAKHVYPHLNIKNLTKDDAIAIYKTDYWLKNDCHIVPEVLRLCYFDCCVNQGPARAKRLIQKALHLQSDGILGSQSRARFQEVEAKSKENQADYLVEYLALRMSHYGMLSHFKTFGMGWSRRLMDVAAISLKNHWLKK